MTKIEKKFMKVFGIEPKRQCMNDRPCYHIECSKCDYSKYVYPEITDRILLQLMCIISTVYPTTINFRETVEELKDFILSFCIRHSREMNVKQVKALFESEVE